MKNRSKETVVIIDDDLVIREVVKVFLGKLRKSYGLNIEALSSANGVEGLGLVIAAEPSLVVIDSTLPKYSGVELVDFITSNPKFSEENLKVIVITEDDKDLGLPENYVVIPKNNVEFLRQLLVEISKTFEYKEDVEPSKLELWMQRTTLNFGKRAIFWSNKSVLTLGKAEKFDLFKKITLYLKWVICQFFTSFYLTLLFLFSPRLKEGSIDQHKLDLKEYRVRYYPMISFFMVFVFILISQVMLLFTGSLVVGTYRFESIITLAVERNQKEVDLEKSEFDSNKIVYDNGNLSMRPVTQELTPQPSEDVGDTEESIDDSIQPDQESADKQEIGEQVTDDETDGTLENEETSENNTEQIEDSDSTDQDSTQEEVEQTDESTQDSGSTDSTQDSLDAKEQQVLGVTDEIETKDLYSMEHPAVEFKEEVEFDSIYEILEDSNINSFESSKNDPEASRKLSDKNVITYQLSPNGKDWYYINENDSWEKTVEGWATSNTVQELNLQLSTFAEDVEADSLFIKAFFNSDGDMNLILNKLVIVRNLEVVSRVKPNYLEKRTVDQDDLPDQPTDSVDDMVIGDSLELNPIILNASYFNEEKIVSGRVEVPDGSEVSDADLAKYKVKIYYTDSRDLKSPASNKGRYIGEADLEKIQKFGEYQYVYELRTSGKEGGFVTAQIEYVTEDTVSDEKLLDTKETGITTTVKRLSQLSRPVKNSTFSVTETGDQSDATLDGLCDYDTVTPGSQCTLRAAIEESNSNTGEDTINFALLETDPNYDASNGPAGAWTISPNDTYFIGDSDLLIDGFSQVGTSRNTGGLHEADNAVLRVQVTSFNLSGDLYGATQLLRVGGDNNEFRGIVFSGDPTTRIDRSGPFLFYSGASNNWVHGCYVGIAPDGVTQMKFRSTGGDLIQSSGTSNLIVGSNGDGVNDNSERNIIANGLKGVSVYGGTNIEVRGNFFGIDKTGTVPFSINSHDTSFANDAVGIYPYSYYPVNNVLVEYNIMGSHDRGILISGRDDTEVSNVEIRQNCIGTDLSCDSPLNSDNNALGIGLNVSGSNYIWNNVTVHNNYVGSHYMAGVSFQRWGSYYEDTLSGVEISNNSIGVGMSGGAIPNWNGLLYGVGEGNSFTGNIVKNNINYGINASSELDPSHSYYDVDENLLDSLDLIVSDNTITDNGSSGIYLSEDTTQTRRIKLESNKVYNNGDLDLDINGGTEDIYKVTENDEGDSDTGANLLMNYPEITKVQYLGLGKYRVVGEVDNSQDEGPYDIEICESSDHESGHGGCSGSLNILRDKDPSFEGRFEIEGSDGYDERVLTLLATNSEGNTSEYSENFVCEESESRYEILDFNTELIFPIGGAELEDGKPEFDWESSISETDDILNPNVDNYKLYLDGQLLAVLNEDDTDYIPGLPIQSGQHEWYVAAFSENGIETDRSVTENFVVPESEEDEDDEDDQNNQNQTSQIQIVRESEYTFELVSPVDETLDTSIPFFDWTDIDDQSGADEYNLYVNDSLIDTVISTDISEYQLTEKDGLGEGQHSWYAVALENIEGSRAEIARTLTGSFVIELPDTEDSEEDSDLDEKQDNNNGGNQTSNTNEGVETSEDDSGDSLSTFQKVAIEGLKVSSLVTVAYGSISVFSYLGALSFQGFYTGILRIYFFILSILGLRSKGEPWGRVYDSKTKIPISRAVVRLYTIHGELIDTAVTDENGVFNFYPKSGEYKLEVRYPNYTFPSRTISGSTDGPKKHIYTGGVYEVKSSENIVKVNIPIDPKRKDKLPDFVKRAFSFIRSIIFIINPYILGLGAVLAFGAYYFVGGWINLVSGIVNVLFIGWHLYLNWLERVKWGLVVDEKGEKLSGVEIALFDKKYDKLVDKQFTDEYGRFRFVVVGGDYILKPIDSDYVINDESKRSGYEVGEQKDEDIVITMKVVVRSTES